MGKISQKKENKKSVTLAAISGAVNDGVSKTGQAIKEHLIAFSGNDYENGNFYKRSLKELNKSKVNSNYLEQNIKQQSGFAAEIKSTARRNAENIGRFHFYCIPDSDFTVFLILFPLHSRCQFHCIC
jgi:hypothetical protein